MGWFSKMLGIDPIKQNFNTGSTQQFGDFYNQMMNQGDVRGQELIRRNMMDSAPTLNSMLGAQQATGGSGAIAAQQTAQGQARAGNMASNAILQSRSADLGRAMQGLQGQQQGQQWSAGMNYNQLKDNRDQRASFANSMIGTVGGLAAYGKLGGLKSLAGSAMGGAKSLAGSAMGGARAGASFGGGLLNQMYNSGGGLLNQMYNSGQYGFQALRERLQNPWINNNDGGGGKMSNDGW